uniref:Transmembrane protein 26 n=1 Tax=Anopheles melas TaxID=34690 RepID=A0A182TYW0_9DIPT
MAKLLATFKATLTRILFAAHGFIAIWQVTQNKKEPIYWCLCAPIGVLFIEGIFTLAIKKNQEWRWFCPSVFLYLSSIVPAIWLLELDKLDKRTRYQDRMLNETINLAATVGKDLKDLNKMLGVKIQLPDIQLTAEMWVTLIEQFLMLVLIIGRWMLPKGDLTRDQLSQLLLVYIGTAADIIEFFDSFKDAKIANEPVLVLLTLSIWSWSLLQFTIVLSATRARKPRGGGAQLRDGQADDASCCNVACCNIDVWGIALNILLQDAPFLTFRLLIIVHYKIITYMNIFFTCKSLYRLYVVNSENWKTAATKRRLKMRSKAEQSASRQQPQQKQRKISKRSSSSRKDTGYSTASSQTTAEQRRLRKSTAKPRPGTESDGDDPLPPPIYSDEDDGGGGGGGDDRNQSDGERVGRRSKDGKDRKSSSRHTDGNKTGGSSSRRKQRTSLDSDRSEDGADTRHQRKSRKGADGAGGSFEIIHEKSSTGQKKQQKKKNNKSKRPASDELSSSSGATTSGSSSESE